MGRSLEMIAELLLWPSPTANPSFVGIWLRDLGCFYAENDSIHSKTMKTQ
jgi:hypothetical protein